MELGFKEKVVSLILNYVSMFRKLILVRAIIRIDQTVQRFAITKVCRLRWMDTILCDSKCCSGPGDERSYRTKLQLPGQSETNDARQSDKLSQCLWKRDKTNSRAVDRFWSRISHSARCSLGCSFRFCHTKLIVWVKFSNYFFWKRLSICAFYGDLYLVNSLQPTLVSLFISGTTCILLQSCLSIVC